MRIFMTLIGAALISVAPTHAAVVRVEINGTVEYNQVRSGPLAAIRSGDAATVSFLVDSGQFQDSGSFPTRGYAIDPSSYALTAGTATVGLADPFPGTPYFVLRNNDPAVDGFFLSDNVDWPYFGVALNEEGFCGPFESHYETSYDEQTLSSLDILDALGAYGYDGLSSFYFTVNDCGFEPISISYESMTIAAVPVDVPVDVKPGSCTNPFNMDSRGVVPVAIMGTPDLDVATIDPASIRLDGVAPLRSHLEDVGGPYEPYSGRTSCTDACGTEGPDGIADLVLHFDATQLAAALADVHDGDCVTAGLTGSFALANGGGAIQGEDVLTIIKNTGGNRTPISRIAARPKLKSALPGTPTLQRR